MSESTPFDDLRKEIEQLDTFKTLESFTFCITAMCQTLEDILKCRQQSGFSIKEEELISESISSVYLSWYSYHYYTALDLWLATGESLFVYDRLDRAVLLAKKVAHLFKVGNYQVTVLSCASMLSGDNDEQSSLPQKLSASESNKNRNRPVWNNAFSFTTEGEPIHNSPVAPKATVPQGLTRNETVGASAMSRMSISSTASSRPGTPSALLRNGSMGATAFSRLALSSFSEALPGTPIVEGEASGARRASRHDSRTSSRAGSRRNSIRDGAKASRRSNKENYA